MTKLYRSKNDSFVMGVCGGIGRYLNVDSTIVRLIFVLLTFFNGFGVLLYFLMAIITPLFPEDEDETEVQPIPLSENPFTAKIIGGGLVLVGVFALIDNINIRWLSWINFSTLFPLVLIGIGGVLIYKVYKSQKLI